MAKKDKDSGPNPSSVANRDIIQRLNFLYQSSVYLNSIPSPPSSSSPQKRKRTENASDLSRRYVDVMRVVGNKTMVKMDPGIKRTLCKGCGTVLIPGSTASVRVKKSPVHGHVMTYTCTECNTFRRIPAPPTKDDDPAPQHSAGTPLPNRRKNKARLPPLFARDSEHAVFVGNEEISNIDGRNGLFVM